MWTHPGLPVKGCTTGCRGEVATLLRLRWTDTENAKAYAATERTAIPRALGAAPEGHDAWRLRDGLVGLRVRGTTTTVAMTPDAATIARLLAS